MTETLARPVIPAAEERPERRHLHLQGLSWRRPSPRMTLATQQFAGKLTKPTALGLTGRQRQSDR